MTYNLPKQVRFALYVFTALGSILVTYLTATGVAGANEVSAWTAFTAFIAGLAGFNTR